VRERDVGRRASGQPSVSRPGPDAGTAIPLIMLAFLLAGTFICASIAASAAFLAQRDLAGICDGAAVAAANGFSRSVADNGPATGSGDRVSRPDSQDTLPLDAGTVQRIVAAYQARQARGDERALSITATTDGRVATVTCNETVRIPFGAVIGEGDGLDRTVVVRARSPLD
jgi:hypothetical protein